MSDTLALTLDLMARNSVTPADGGCQQVMMERLAAAGFAVERVAGFGRKRLMSRGTLPR